MKVKNSRLDAIRLILSTQDISCQDDLLKELADELLNEEFFFSFAFETAEEKLDFPLDFISLIDSSSNKLAGISSKNLDFGFV